MKNSVVLFLSLLCTAEIYSQEVLVNQLGIITTENLKTISNISPSSPGTLGFDNRYEGVRGSPRLFDTLGLSYFLITGQKDYITLKSDIDVMRSALVFIQAGTGDLMEISSDYRSLYGPDRRYDELKDINKYYISGSDVIFYRVQLNVKSLVKIFPDKKEVIRKELTAKDEAEAELQVIKLLNKF